MWSIWHKVVIINEWRASTSKQCVFCLPNTSELVKHEFWDYIQMRRAWRWATVLMCELCGFRIGNYDSSNLGKGLLQRIPKNYGKMCKILHLLRGITLWTIWIEPNDKVFNREQWHKSKVKQRIWDKVIIYFTTAWNRVIEQIKFFTVDMLQSLTKLGVLGTFFVEGIISILSGIGKDNVDKRSNSLSKASLVACGRVFLVLINFGVECVGLLSKNKNL